MLINELLKFFDENAGGRFI